MFKKILLFFIIALTIMLSACGETYTCKNCKENVSQAYYDMDASINQVMCADCARKYWMPIDYKTHRVK